jgi:hypothetical protein
MSYFLPVIHSQTSITIAMGKKRAARSQSPAEVFTCGGRHFIRASTRGKPAEGLALPRSAAKPTAAVATCPNSNSLNNGTKNG